MGRAKPVNLRAGPGLGSVRAYIFEPIIIWAGLGPGPLKYQARFGSNKKAHTAQ